ncbi:MAG: hypothetical protein HRT57_09045 [Crocinitomicaceae bacterium]|nr:hypothetical protein [Crocinitomicaceae bacterium]
MSCTATATDPTGNVYITGHYSGTIDFDPGPSTFNLNSNGPYNLFIEKLDANGDFLWAKSMDGGLGYNSVNVITTDESGNVLIAGLYFDTTDFDPGAGTYELIPTGANEIFISKFDTDGNFLWAASIDGELNSESNRFISTDMDDNVFLIASFENTIDVDPGAGVFNLTSNGASDSFILKLDPTGNFQWAKSIGGIEDDFTSNVAVDPSGNVLVSGLYDDTVDFNPEAAVFNLINEAGLVWNSQFYAVFKLDANGNFIWAKSMGDWDL